jgi:sulfate-transporting ATPase
VRRLGRRDFPDRWFLDRIATHILAFEGESKVTFFDGNFSDYEE